MPARVIVLCVDDEKTVLSSLRQELEFFFQGKLTIELAESAEEGLEIMEELAASKRMPELVISDHLMPGMKGDAFLAELHRRYPSLQRMLLSGLSAPAEEGNLLPPDTHILHKPWDAQQLRQALVALIPAIAH